MTPRTPNNPKVGDTCRYYGTTYRWNGRQWVEVRGK